MKAVIVRYGELALKSERVRRGFERRLIENIELSIKGIDHELRRERGRIFIDTNSVNVIARRLTEVPGIVSVSPSIRVNATIDSICSTAVKVAKKVLSRGMSFAVRTSRVGEHAFSSREVNERVGAAILKNVGGTRVDLSAPEQEISIEIRGGSAYVFVETKGGVGGLPVGTQGNVVTLFSSGLNSWVTNYLMMKRGCMVIPVLPDPRPMSGDREFKLSIRAARRLASFYPKLELRVLPTSGLLRALAKATPNLMYFIYKRFSLRAAEAIAKQTGAEAIAAYEGLEQVAGQGLASLSVMDEACELPILRPLAGMDENDIVRIARDTGLFRPSVQSLADLIPGPADLTPRVDEVREIEGKLKIGALIELALSKIGIIKVR